MPKISLMMMFRRETVASLGQANSVPGTVFGRCNALADMSRQCPLLSIRIVIWILLADIDTDTDTDTLWCS